MQDSYMLLSQTTTEAGSPALALWRGLYDLATFWAQETFLGFKVCTFFAHMYMQALLFIYVF